MKQKFCTNCGSALEETAVFCSVCGEKTSSENKEQPIEKIPVPVFEKPVKKKRSKLKILGAIISAIVVLFIIAEINSGGSSTAGRDKAIQVKAEEIVSDYISDEAAAEKKYKDKKIIVTGQLIAKHQFKNTQNFGLNLYQKDENGKVYTVVVDVSKDNVGDANKVKEGDFVSAEGTCTGKVDQNNPNFISVQIKANKINP